MTSVPLLSETIDQLAANRPLRPDVVGPLIGVAFSEDPERSNEARTVFSGQSSSGLFAAAIMRCPADGDWGMAGFLDATISDEVVVRQGDVRAQLGQEDGVRLPTMRQPPGSPVALVYQREWADISFTFDVDQDRLLHMVVDETEPDTTETQAQAKA